MKVLIKIINRKTLTIIADDETNEIQVNNIPVDADARKFVAKMTIITSRWEPRYENLKILDGEEYAIKFIDGDKERILSGKNRFPFNYDEFKALINKVVML